MTVPDKQEDVYNVARQYAWDWFAYHAGQRLAVFRFFLLLSAFISTGYVTAMVKQYHSISTILSIVLLISAFLFWRLDRRNLDLVKIAEVYLKIEEQRLKKILGHPEIALVEEADKRDFVKPQRPRNFSDVCSFMPRSIMYYVDSYSYSFRQVYQLIFIVIGIIGAMGFVYGLLHL